MLDYRSADEQPLTRDRDDLPTTDPKHGTRKTFPTKSVSSYQDFASTDALSKFEIDPWTPGKYNFDETPTLRPSPRDSKQSSVRSQRTGRMQQSQSHNFFDRLPAEAYHSILTHIINSYVDGHVVNVASLLRDLVSCALVSKRWYGAAREHIYGHLWLVSNERPQRRRKSFSLARGKGRLELLARTLTEGPHLAETIYAAHVMPGLHAELYADKTLLSKGESSLHLLRKVVDLCPNLEQITGFIPAIEPRFRGYMQALVERSQLRTLAWWTDPARWFMLDFKRMTETQTCWETLETLILCQGELEKPMCSSPDFVLKLVQQMPSLQRLMLSSLPADDVNDETLASLPLLSALRLDNLPGVTDQGLKTFAQSLNAQRLLSLTLFAMDVTDLDTVRTMLEGCAKLLRFKLVSTKSIGNSSSPAALDAGLQSTTLRYIHWDVPAPDPTLAEIAKAIESRALPALQTIKAPQDADARIQSLCRPLRDPSFSSPDQQASTSETEPQQTVRAVQLHAQRRIQEAKQTPSFNVRVADEDDNVQHEDVIGAFLGRIDSSLQYSLEPDVPGSSTFLSMLQDLTPSTTAKSNGTSDCAVLDYDLLF